VSADLMLAIDPGLRVLGATVATYEGRVVDAWLPRSTAKARQVKGERVPAAEGPLAWRGMVAPVLEDLRERGHLERIGLLVLEWPEVYRAGVQKFSAKGKRSMTNPNDLLELAAVEGGLVWGLPVLARYERYTPREWKKSFRKERYQEAILAALAPEERAMVGRTTESLRHNVIESVGLARFMATILAGQPMSVPAFQGRAVSAASTTAAGQPAWRTPLPPTSSPGAESYGSRHAGEFKTSPPSTPKGKALTTALRTMAKPATYPPEKP
jgi:hypothetical protein